ncbi:MAG: DNA-processing protein DprA [Oscillospiraceae bacterium]|nr:DNA-processing protein DprA [Oscillospiraceae bacterium]
MENNILYQLWLNLRLGHDHYKVDKAIRLFDSAENIYHAEKLDKSRIFHLGLGSLFAFRDKSLDEAKRIVEECEKKNIQMITMDDERYPKRLRQIPGHPSILYVKGELPDIDNLVTIGIVGTRICTPYGQKMAHDIAYELSKCGVLIVSGMADGIDRCAHVGALKAGKPTVAVLAGGVDVIYPRTNKDLYDKIQEPGFGAVIAEEPPGYPTKGFKFPIRNRIIAGLSMGSVIVEGLNRSGARHTANYALEFNRDLFAVPHNASTSTGQLPNRLIGDGAKITRGAFDVLSEYLAEYPELLVNNLDKDSIPEYEYRDYSADKRRGGGMRKQAAPAQPKPTAPIVKPKPASVEQIPKYSELNNTEQMIVKYIYDHDTTHIDEIIRGSELDVTAVNSGVMMLQMKGVIAELPGKKYTLA